MTERAIYYFIIWQKSQSDLLQVIVQDIAKHCRACFPIGQYYTCVCVSLASDSMWCIEKKKKPNERKD